MEGGQREERKVMMLLSRSLLISCTCILKPCSTAILPLAWKHSVSDSSGRRKSAVWLALWVSSVIARFALTAQQSECKSASRRASMRWGACKEERLAGGGERVHTLARHWPLGGALDLPQVPASAGCSPGQTSASFAYNVLKSFKQFSHTVCTFLLKSYDKKGRVALSLFFGFGMEDV